MSNIITIDTGGTFTDVAIFDSERGTVGYGKSLTDYNDLIENALSSLRDLRVSLSETTLLKHGTTHVINTFIQRSGARTALITTRGFRDGLEICRGNRPVPFSLEYRRDEPLVDRRMRFEVDERIDGQGRVLRPLNVEELDRVAQALLEMDVEAVAVSFLNSYANPAHEAQAVRHLERRIPGAYVTCGTALSREWFEYERTSTAVANAYVGAKMSRYINRFDQGLRRSGFGGTLYMMGSNGGTLSVTRTLHQPVSLIESGPVGGCIGAAAYARALGISKLIAFDMGGTTAKCALVRDGQFDVQPLYYVGGYDRGFPLQMPVLDIVEVGAGGGSIASVDDFGRLAVGPRSAGSEPGPAAFARGGVEPTVTDANVVLGRIAPGRFLNGALKLDAEAARRAIRERVTEPLGGGVNDSSIDRAAQGILELAAARMCSAIKEITIERGHDAREYTLFAFGGGGALFASELARLIGISRVVVPPNPGNFCVVGMLLCGARIDLTRTVLIRDMEQADSVLNGLFEELEAEASEAVRAELRSSVARFERFVELRYQGQKHAVRVRHHSGDCKVSLTEAFIRDYERQYGQSLPANAIEIIGVHLVTEVDTPRPDLGQLINARGDTASQKSEGMAYREVYVSPRLGRLRVPVLNRHAMRVGQAIEGPAVIEEFSGTIFLQTGDRAVIGEFGEIDIRIR